MDSHKLFHGVLCTVISMLNVVECGKCATKAPLLSFAQVAVVVTEPMPEVVEDISTPLSEPVEAPGSGISQA